MSVSSVFNLICHLLFLATSVDVECVFSKGRQVLSYVRNHLSVDSTQALLCLGAWISKEDIETAAGLPDVMEGEEEAEDEFYTVL